MDYIFLAEKTVKLLPGLLTCAQENDWYNILMVECEQAAENSMKAVLFLLASEPSDKALLLGHHLMKLAKRINKLLGYKAFAEIECSWLEHFYEQYPGDNFIVADNSDAVRGIEIAEKVYAASVEILSKHDGNNIRPVVLQDTIADIIAYLEANRHPALLKVLLFGSCARGTANIFSDADICCVFKDGTNLHAMDVIMFKSALAGCTAEPFDIVTCTESMLNTSEAVLYQDIRRDSIQLLPKTSSDITHFSGKTE